MLAESSSDSPRLWRVRRNWDMVRPMIIKQGDFASFSPSELRRHPAAPHPIRPEKLSTPSNSAVGPMRAEILAEVERLVRENERLTLERDQLREELSRQSLAVRRAKLVRPRPATPALPQANRAEKPKAGESQREIGDDDPGYELARVVVNWFWEDPDEASVRLVHDALTGQGIRTIVRDADPEDG